MPLLVGYVLLGNGMSLGPTMAYASLREKVVQPALKKQYCASFSRGHLWTQLYEKFFIQSNLSFGGKFVERVIGAQFQSILNEMVYL